MGAMESQGSVPFRGRGTLGAGAHRHMKSRPSPLFPVAGLVEPGAEKGVLSNPALLALSTLIEAALFRPW